MNEFLDTDEVIRLTGKKRKDEQANWFLACIKKREIEKTALF